MCLFGGRALLATSAAAGLLPGAARAADPRTDAYHDNTRKVLEDIYVNEYSKGDGLYETAPITHVVPSFKTVTFALQAASYDVKMKTDTFGSYSPGGQSGSAEQQMTLSGQTFAPYVAISLRRIGLGFSGEEGTRALHYSLYDKAAPNSATTSYAATQSSQMQYKAVGVYAYLLPLEAKGDQPLLGSVVIGVKEYNVTHTVSPITAASGAGQGTQDNASTVFRYDLTEYMVGSLLEWQILKRFSLMPWLTWTYIDIHDPVGQADAILKGANTDQSQLSTASCLKGDSFVFWRARPPVATGLDLVARIGDLALHLGTVFGFLLNTHNTNVITDTSFKLGLSFDMKGE